MANSQSGKNKAFQISYEQIAALDTECRTVTLTRQQIYSLLVQSAYIGWRTRWQGAPQDFSVDEFQAGVQVALMNDCDCWDCGDVAECIETSEAIQNLLKTLIQNTVNGTPGNELTEAQKNTRLDNQGNAPGCDDNALWGACLYTVQTLNRLNEDFLEGVEAITSNQETVSFLVSAIPVLETLPIDEFIAAADKIRDFVATSYRAGYDLDFENEMACDLFCLAKANDCELTLLLVRDYFWGRAQAIEGFEDAFQSALTIISAMASWQELVGEKIVLTLMAANVGFMNFLNESFGLSFGEFVLQTRAGIPDDDWIALCDCVPEIIVIVPDTQDSWFGGTNIGGTIELIGVNRYRVTMTLSTLGTDFRAVWKSEDGLPFVMTDIVVSGGIACQYWAGTPNFFDGCNYSPANYTGQPITSMGITANGVSVMEFTVSRP